MAAWRALFLFLFRVLPENEGKGVYTTQPCGHVVGVMLEKRGFYYPY